MLLNSTQENRMDNIVTAAELKRRGMAALEEGLRRGPVRIVKRNKLAAVVVSERDYAHLSGSKQAAVAGMSAMQWLLAHAGTGRRSKKDIDAALRAERSW
jgi:hypothetical protein